MAFEKGYGQRDEVKEHLRAVDMGNAMSSSFAPECTEAKKQYDDCFNNWYTEKFLKGKSLYNECDDLWHDYKACVDLALAKQGILPMLEEAREEAPFEKGGEVNDKSK